MKATYINKLVSFSLMDETAISGIVLNYNDEWTLLRLNPVDFVLDGYALLKNDYIAGFKHGADEIFREKVILLKEKNVSGVTIPITDIATIVSFLSKKYGAFQINEHDRVYIGRIREDGKGLKFNFEELSPKGKWAGVLKIGFDEIHVIEFDTDYINSLLLVSTADLKKNTASSY